MAKKKNYKKTESPSSSYKSDEKEPQKTKEFLEELIKAGKITKEEGEKFLKKFWEDTEEEREYFKEKIEKLVKQVKERVGAPSREEFKELEKRVEALEEKIQQNK